MSIKTTLKLYDTSGARQPLPIQFVKGWSFELLERGGCGTFDLTLDAEIGEKRLRALPRPDWRLDILFDGAVIYRGRVDSVDPQVSDGPNRYLVQGVGLMSRLSMFLTDTTYSHARGTDISEVFSWLATHYCGGEERIPDLVTAIEPEIGYVIQDAAFFGSDVRHAFDQMSEAAADLLIWGIDVSPAGRNRLYVRKRPASVVLPEYRFRVGKNVGMVSNGQDISNLTNAIRLVGGKSKTPNLVYNPSFELPALPESGNDGNILRNSSFEKQSQAWTYHTNDALHDPEDSVRQQSGGEGGEYARTGAWFAEIDDAGDWVQQAQPVAVPGVRNYVLLFYHCLESPPKTTHTYTRILVECLNSNNQVIATPINNEDVECKSRTYEEVKRTFTSPDGTAKIRVKLQKGSGPRDLFVDDVFVYDADRLGQEGWEIRQVGAARCTIDWSNRGDGGGTYHNAYCVRADVTNIGGGSIRIQPTDAHWCSVRDQTQYVVRCWVRGADGLQIRLGAEKKKSNNSKDTAWGDTYTLNAANADANGWQKMETVLSSGPDCTSYRPIIQPLSLGAYYIDAVQVFEDGIAENRDAVAFLDGESLNYYFRADDPALGDLTPEAASSIATYGLRETTIQVEEIEDYAAAKTYATGLLNRQAVPERRGKLTLEPCRTAVRYVTEDDTATPIGRVEIVGAGETIPAQSPARIVYTMTDNGMLKCDMELGSRKPDPALLLKRALARVKTSGGGGGSGGAANLQSTPANTAAGGGDLVSPTWQAESQALGQQGALNIKAGTAASVQGADGGSSADITIGVALGAGADQAAPGNHSHVIAGDVTGYLDATSVDKIKGKPVQAPSADKYLFFNGTDLEWRVPATSIGKLLAYGPWVRANVNSADTSYTFADQTGVSSQCGQAVPLASKLLGLTISLSAPLTTGEKYDAEVYRLNPADGTWSATGIQAVVDGDATTAIDRRVSVYSGGNTELAAKDVLGVKDKRTGTITSAPSAWIWLLISAG